ncbi:hypothetical protein C8U37_11096 [Trichococcus patagoniensis]|uniref:Uncharacterized protein n=1 Tax=Trichococcus patagoniensis TaxID=382641 RepID=A0A2T5IK34_9LACT|nr:hypothetical protein C8U37_11096 [Trichococcus patagoniensis]
MRERRLFSDEQALVGGEHVVRSPAPAKGVLAGVQEAAPFPPVNGPLTGVAVSGNLFPPVSEFWPELTQWTRQLLRLSRSHRSWESRGGTSSGEAGSRRSWGTPQPPSPRSPAGSNFVNKCVHLIKKYCIFGVPMRI